MFLQAIRLIEDQKAIGNSMEKEAVNVMLQSTAVYLKKVLPLRQ